VHRCKCILWLSFWDRICFGFGGGREVAGLVMFERGILMRRLLSRACSLDCLLGMS